jgi:RNA polymerase sigma-70 factor (ECF subfamily)
LVQDVFLAAHRALPKLKERDRLRGWLSTIAVRKSMVRLRRARLRRFLSLSEETNYHELADPGASPEARAEVSRLYEELDQMGAKERVLWVLRHLEGRTLDDMVEQTGMSKSTIQRRLKKAEEHLLRRTKSG